MNRLHLAASKVARLCATFVLSAIAVSASAQTTTVTGQNLKMGGAPIASGTVSITPTNGIGTDVPFTGGDGSINAAMPFTAVITNGTVASGFTVPDQALSLALTANTPLFYRVSVLNTATKQSYSFLLPPGTLTGSTWALDGYKPTQTAAALSGFATGTVLPTGMNCAGSSRFVLYAGQTITAAYSCVNGKLLKEPTSTGSGSSLTYRGAYANANSYAVGDIVTLAGSSYTALQAQAASAGQTPGAATAYWGLLAAAGVNGTNGTNGSGNGSGVDMASCQGQLGGGSTAIVADTYTVLCYNDKGQPWTVKGFHAYADAGSTTVTATNAAGTSLLASAVTGGPGMPAGTLSSTTTVASGDYIKMTITTDGVTKSVMPIFTMSYPAVDGTSTGTPSFSLGTAATPTISPAAGTYTGAQTITLADTTSGASIYYTVDGSTPSATSTKYTAPFTGATSGSQTVKAIAVASGYGNSAVASSAYTIQAQAAAPTFSPAAGNYSSTQTVTLTSATSGATIYYTTDGSTPTSSSSVYSSPISVSASKTIKAIAVASGSANSTVASAAYTIGSPIAYVQTVVGTGNGAVGLNINCTKGNTLIVYGGSYASGDVPTVSGESATLIGSKSGTSNNTVAMYRATCSTGGSETINVSSSTNMDAAVVELSGVSGIDVYGTESGQGQSAAISVTTTAAKTVMIGGMTSLGAGGYSASSVAPGGWAITIGSMRRTFIQTLTNTATGAITWAPNNGAGSDSNDAGILVAVK